MQGQDTHTGHTLALTASLLLFAAAVTALCTIGIGFYLNVVEGRSLQNLAGTTPLPLVASMIWLTTVGGTAAAIVSAVVYGFRARWFWRCMVAVSVIWLLAPPIHLVIGLISLIVLLALRRHFPREEMPAAVAP